MSVEIATSFMLWALLYYLLQIDSESWLISTQPKLLRLKVGVKLEMSALRKILQLHLKTWKFAMICCYSVLHVINKNPPILENSWKSCPTDIVKAGKFNLNHLSSKSVRESLRSYEFFMRCQVGNRKKFSNHCWLTLKCFIGPSFAYLWRNLPISALFNFDDCPKFFSILSLRGRFWGLIFWWNFLIFKLIK